MNAPPLTYAYVTKGFCSVVYTDISSAVTSREVAGSGEISMFYRLMALAELCEDKRDKEEVDDWPGVWDYDISEPFGRWVGEYAREFWELPTDEKAAAQIDKLYNEVMESWQA